ncbi:hypothetical protein SAMN05421847_0145 [Halpernia humi]|uniref:DUF1508 domain-containing protein n=1 Tax=Halpernia humi TaxID=493375 RepID=A0A1H5SHI0_9FLAO|nr:YegP family protein [Halpernia humi]SEF49884.1 hypothetical protein SAMN05421847_0145 [Halpernia humi]
MGKFVITKRVNDEYQFNLKAGNGEIILTSQGYKSKSGCTNGISSVRVNSQIDSQFERKIAVNNSYYFLLKAGNGEPIGKSQMYSTKQSMEKGIDSVKENAPNAETIDETI